jgi:CRISPR system Cascade subunit CasE
MFLSNLLLNTRDRQGRYDLARPYDMHRTLWRAFPEGDPGRVLFRVDTDRFGAKPVILVQSEFEPEWSKLPVGYVIKSADCKSLALSVVVGQRLRFRLRANPTKRVAPKNENLGGVMAGKRIGLTTEADQVRWLLRKGESGGFRIPGQWVEARDPRTNVNAQIPNFRLDIVPEGRDRNGKPGHAGEFLAVRFDGLLEVTDPERFVQKSVRHGLGSAKGFGFGLLSLAPARV